LLIPECVETHPEYGFDGEEASMTKLNNISTYIKPIFLAGAGLVIILLTLTACSTTNYGSLKGSSEVTQLFEKNQILPDHDYYFYGFQRIPYAIIGVHRDYKLYSKVWQYIKLTPTSLNQLLYRMDVVYRTPPRGAWILDADGKRIGIWYSSEYSTAVKTRPDNQILIVPPKPPDLTGMP